MKNNKLKLQFFNKTTLSIIGVLLIVLSAVFLVWQGNENSNQSIATTSAQVYFDGDYKIGDGEWQKIKSGEHISSTIDDVTLRGNFYMLTPSGEYIGLFKGGTAIAFYTNHINLTFYEVDRRPYSIDNENPRIGESACGENWTAYQFTNATEIIEIVIKNPHKYGNENAIDEMLANIAFRGNMEFQSDVLDVGAPQRNMGLFFAIASIMFLGTAIFSSLIHVKKSKIIWLLGLIILFAGLYLTYNSFGIPFWSESIILNTTMLGVSMMLYMFFLSLLIVSSFKVVKRVGVITCVGLGAAVTTIFIIAMATSVYFYDTLLYWVIIQSVANVSLTICLIKEITLAKGKDIFVYSGAILSLIAFMVDAISTYFGWWEGGIISPIAFVVLFIVAMIILLRILPSSINALAKAEELEKEKLILNTQLTESRVSTMMSQIRPHFIYNTLGSIEQLCELDPPKAGELVHDFAKYLRGNFGELDNPKPILMSQEMEHVHHYIKIENVRFPDMTFTFEMNSNDFEIPALTIQPIVENAIKHGLMKLSKGGTIKVLTYETDDNYCVLVEDDGVGFDTSVLLDERKHVGIRNIRGRLEAMVNGALQIESEIGKGTKVLITIPKGVG